MADDWTTEQILRELWDDGNAVGLDGYTGPGRGAYVVDGEAIAARDVATKKGRERLAATIRQAKAEAWAEGFEDRADWLAYRRDPRVSAPRPENPYQIAAGGDQT